MAEREHFTETTSSLARAAGCLPETVRLYAKLRLIESIVLPSGVRLFKASAAPVVKRIYAERLARRGGNHRGAAAG